MIGFFGSAPTSILKRRSLVARKAGGFRVVMITGDPSPHCTYRKRDRLLARSRTKRK